MALVLADRVKETSTTTGTGTFSLSGAASGYESFVAGVGNGNTTYYAIINSSLNEWEVGLGTVTDGTPDTLARTTILASSNSDSAVSFGSGTKDVFCTYPATKSVYKNADGSISNVVQTITSTDGSVTTSVSGSSVDLSVAVAAATNNVVVQVRNSTGATLTKGTVVYINGATGQTPTVTKAIATGDSTSAQTLGMITADLANNASGNVTIIGLITNIDTSAYADGAQLYLSGSTAGAVTTTKPYAPTHLVYVGIVEYSHATNGKIFVKVQNGYELEELHDVSAQSPTNGQTIVYNSSNSLWEKNTVSLTAGVNGTLPVANGGTGVTTSTGSGNNVLSTSPTLVTPILGTPTSATLTNATGLPLTTGVTGTLPAANGGTGITSPGSSGNVLTSDGAGSWTSSAPAASGISTGKSIAMALIFGF